MKVDIGIFDFSQVHSHGSELGYLPEFYGKNMDLELTGFLHKNMDFGFISYAGYATGKSHFLPDFCHIG